MSLLWGGDVLNPPQFFSLHNSNAKGIFQGLNFRILYLLEMIYDNLLTLSLFSLDNMKFPISLNLNPCIELKGSRGYLHIFYIPSKSKVLFSIDQLKGFKK